MSERIFEEIRRPEKETASIREALTRGVARDEKGDLLILPDRNSLEREMSSRRMRLYLGIDPTSPELHIGHTVPLRKLRQFQDLGHEVILLFGTFTGKIGDPTDRGATRLRLTDEQITQNLRSYEEQAGKILDLSENAKNPVSIRFNDEWLAPLTFEQLVDLAANFTVQQMQARSTFKKRLGDGKPIGLHEFFYPLMQGYDSVAMDVDLEVGGKDQIPNMLDGRTLIKAYRNHEKWVLGTALIEDPSGKKMGKTEGNIVNIRDFPEIKYEGIMSWPDTAIAMGFELITSVPMENVDILSEKLQSGEISPLEAKEALAFRVVAELDGVEEAKYAQEEFDGVKRKGKLPKRIRETEIEKGSKLSLALVSSGLAKDEGDAVRKIAQGGIFIDGKPVNKNLDLGSGEIIIQIGKRTIKSVRKIKLG